MLHELAETIRQRALIMILSDFFIQPKHWQVAFSTCDSVRHDVAIFHLLDPLELDFKLPASNEVPRHGRWSGVFAGPNDIVDRYNKVFESYLQQLKQVVLESAIDYQRVTIDENYEQALVRFLVGRAQARGCDELPSTVDSDRTANRSVCRSLFI